MIEKIKNFATNRNNLLVLILAGILLMVIALPVDNGKEKTEDAAETSGPTADIINNDSFLLNGTEEVQDTETEKYIAMMEQKVEELLCKMEGAGKVKVIITLRTSVEKIVEKDIPVSRSNTTEEDSQGGMRTVNTMDTGESTVYSTAGNASQPYVVKTVSPEVEGVLVLAEGAGNGTVSRDLSDAIQVLFGIEAHRVKIVKMECTK